MQTGRLRWAFVVSALIASCLGCHVTSERFIVGTYRAEAPCVTITLVLNRDHSFVQSARTAAGETKQVKGKWFIRQWGTDHPTEKTVDFDSFLDFHEDYHGREGGPGETGFIPERWPRGVLMGPIIVQCPDSGYKIDYVK
jgi:hypothetical protein